VQDPQLLAQIESLREKIREYKPKTMHATAPVEPSKDVIKLGKKNKDGSISRVSETVPTANAVTVSATSAAE
jgi:hypothetical protein